jgi:1-acyl-sn-glycerol-3-phosphate acyltransferase
MNIAARFINFLLYCFSRVYLGLSVKGRENIPSDGQALLVANHSSYVDGIVMQASLKRPILYLMAADIINKSYFKKLFEAMGYIPVNRNGKDLSAFRNALRALKKGRLVGIFPEGRINCRPYPGKFKLGAVQLARNAGVPIIPVGIRNAFKTYLHKKEFPLPGKIEVNIGEPIDFAELGDEFTLEELSELIKRKISELIREETVTLNNGLEKIALIDSEISVVNENA